MTNPSKTAQALWVIEAGKADLRALPVSVGDGEVFVKTLYSGISRGTERLVFNGHVPESEHETMRAPFQEGTFHYPVKYGYSAVGVVEGGARDGERVFALFPHQSEFSIPTDMALTIPNNVPTRRAILAANMETALNIVWDAGVGPGDRVLVVGCGVVGAFAGYLAAQIIGTEVTLVDLDEERAELAAFLGCAFCTPAATFGDADVVVHASASDAGLATAIGCAGPEATIVEASWYGTAPTSVPLGGRFHQRRLKLVGSQVGTIPPARAPRWDHARRLRKALSLLNDDRLDALISSESRFEDLPSDYGEILHNPQTLCHCVRYD